MSMRLKNEAAEEPKTPPISGRLQRYTRRLSPSFSTRQGWEFTALGAKRATSVTPGIASPLQISPTGFLLLPEISSRNFEASSTFATAIMITKGRPSNSFSSVLPKPNQRVPMPRETSRRSSCSPR